jgi:hypothetical protein
VVSSRESYERLFERGSLRGPAPSRPPFTADHGLLKQSLSGYDRIGKTETHEDNSSMTTIPIEVSTEQLLRAVDRLPQDELETFVGQVIALRAQRAAPHLSQEETTLLIQINAGLPAGVQQRFEELIAKRQSETITPDELYELIQITDEIERRDAQRLAALIDLARLRQTSVAALMSALGIGPAAYA